MSLGSNNVFITLNHRHADRFQRAAGSSWSFWHLEWRSLQHRKTERCLLIFSSATIWTELEKIYRAWSLPHPALCVAAFPTCRQCTKEKLYGQYLLLVRLAHHSFIGRRGVQRTEHFHAFDSRSVDMWQWYNIRTNHPRKSILASGSVFWPSDGNVSSILAFTSRGLSTDNGETHSPLHATTSWGPGAGE